MNEASKLRIEQAKTVAAVYASHPDVRAIILGGSTARNTAHEHSDIDLGLFWTQVTSQKDRSDLMQRVGGKLVRCVENHLRYSVGNPRRQGCVEIVELKPTSVTPRLRLDIEHETVVAAERVLSEVIDDYDLSLEKQELLSVILGGLVIYGHELVDRWREKALIYPDELAQKMATQHFLGIGKGLLDQVHWARTEDWFCLYEGFLAIGRRLLLTLMGVNRVWAFTDNPDFKGLKPFIDGLELQPDRFADRLGQLLQSDAIDSIRGFVDLSEEVTILIETHLPTVDTLGERERLKEAWDSTTR
jgi:predicted nucleotidyltransferase